MNPDTTMQREGSPVTSCGITLYPLTLRRMNAASAMRCAVFSLDETQRKELLELRVYRGIIRDIIIVFFLCANDETAADLALWNPVAAMSQANIFAEKHRMSEASPDFVEMQLAFWSLVNPIFENDAVPVGDTELGRSKKKHPVT